MRSVCVPSRVIIARLPVLLLASGCMPREPFGRAFQFRGHDGGDWTAQQIVDDLRKAAAGQ